MATIQIEINSEDLDFFEKLFQEKNVEYKIISEENSPQQKKKSIFKVGEEILVPPHITREKEWTKGIVTEIEDNPFVGFVISVKVGDIEFFDKEYEFEKIT